MGRVDEAMRRAEQGLQPAAVDLPTQDVNAAELAHEAPEAEIELRPRPNPDATARQRSAADGPPAVPAPKGPFQSLRQRLSAALSMKIVVDPEMKAGSREQYRRLAAGLHHAQGNSGVKVIMLTSALPGEGKTLTASNLGLMLSESFRRRVMLIDADLRRPGLHTVFNIDGAAGLAEGLAAAEDQPLPLQHVSSYLSILPAGQPQSDPGNLTSTRMRRLIDEARATFDWVIIDTPPIGLLSDAHLLASMVDGVILVVKADDTPYQLAQRAVETMGRERVLGVVLNRAATAGAVHGYSYDKYYHRSPQTPPAG